MGLCECGCGQSTPISKYTDRRSGQVKGKPLRFIHGHSGDTRLLGHTKTVGIKNGRYIHGKSGTNEYESDRRKRDALWLYNYRLAHPCVDCGESDPIVLDFDHRPGTKKSHRRGVSQLAGWASIATLEAEVAKCDVRCANCHRRKTARETNQFAFVLQSKLAASA